VIEQQQAQRLQARAALEPHGLHSSEQSSIQYPTIPVVATRESGRRVSTAREPQPTVSSFAATARDGGCRLAEGRDGAARGRVPALLVSYASRGCVRARPVRFLPSCARACAWCHHVRVALLANLDVAVNRITVLRHRVRFAGVTTARGASRNGRHLARLFIVRFNMLQNLTSHSYTVSGTAVLAVS